MIWLNIIFSRHCKRPIKLHHIVDKSNGLAKSVDCNTRAQWCLRSSQSWGKGSNIRISLWNYITVSCKWGKRTIDLITGNYLFIYFTTENKLTGRNISKWWRKGGSFWQNKESEIWIRSERAEEYSKNHSTPQRNRNIGMEKMLLPGAINGGNQCPH